jgi:hypothetical protein
MTVTIGEIRSSLQTLGERAWSVAPELDDDQPARQFPTGADLADHPLAADVSGPDFDQVVTRELANPLLRTRNLQLRLPALDLQAVNSLDWRDRWGGRWLATVQDQNPCSNCWAFAASALVETMVRIEHGVWSKRSEGDLRDGWGGPTGENWVVRDGAQNTPCVHGAGVTGALDWIQKNGIADPGCYPWSAMDRNYAPTPDRDGRTVRIPRYQALGTVEDAKKWLDAVGPVVAGLDAYDDLGAYSGSGVYVPTATAKAVGGHILLVVGYDDLRQAWIVRNSWGTSWGDKGYGYFGYGQCKIDVFAKFGLRGTNPDPWTKRRLHAGFFFESGNGAEHRNFELVQGSAPRARHLWRDGGSGGFTWHEAGTLESPDDIGAGAGCVGQPAATSTTYNRNFEAVYWELSGRLRHWWMDQTANDWHDSGRFGPTDTEGYPGFIQGSFNAPGNLEVVVRRRGGALQHWFRDGAPGFAWHDAGTITSEVKMSGPSLVQSDVGTPGNFYVVCVTNFGNLQMWWRGDDFVWQRGEVFGSGIGETPVCMIQGEFGATDELTTGNFELCVAVNGHVEHWWRDNSALRSEAPRADSARPGVSDVAHAQRAPRRLNRTPESTPFDLAELLSDRATAQVQAVGRGALGNAVLSDRVDKTVAEQVAAANEVPRRWQRSASFGHDVKHVWGLVQGSFGFNLDVVVELTGGGFQHYYRDGDGWHEAEPVTA